MVDYNQLDEGEVGRSSVGYIIKTFLLKYIPILSWLPHYSLKNLQCDIIAGITVGLMVVPQGLAYASVARLPTQYGLYSSFMGVFVYCIFGTSKDMTVGPTAVLSLLTGAFSVPYCGDMAATLTFCVGVILLVMGVLNLGFIVRFLSIPVIDAFTSATAITIACSQLRMLNGVANTPEDFFGNLKAVFKNVRSWNFYDLGFGLVCIVILSLMRLLNNIKPTSDNDSEISQGRRVLRKFAWFCGISRNAIVVLFSCIIVYILDVNLTHQYLTHVDVVTSGLPPFVPPKFSIVCHNTTTYKFDDILSTFGAGLIVIPSIAFLQALAIGKAFGQMHEYKTRPSQELIALGIANVMGSFISAYPMTGCFSRTAVNSQSGVKTPLAGLVTGLVVVVATQFLGRAFVYIPKACLGAVIISAVLPMVKVSGVRKMWKIRKLDLIPYVGAFLGSFYSLALGLGIGFVLNLCMVLYHVATPHMDTTPRRDDVAVFHIHTGRGRENQK